MKQSAMGFQSATATAVLYEASNNTRIWHPYCVRCTVLIAQIKYVYQQLNSFSDVLCARLNKIGDRTNEQADELMSTRVRMKDK